MSLKQLFGSITVGGFLSALVGAATAYVTHNASPVLVTVIAAVSGVIGVLTHHTNDQIS